MLHPERKPFAEIVEREWRKVHNDDVSPVDVNMDEDELIYVTYKGVIWTCECEGDEDFLFFDQAGNEIIFAIPQDYLNLEI